MLKDSVQTQRRTISKKKNHSKTPKWDLQIEYAKGQRSNLMSLVLSTSKDTKPLSQQYWFAATEIHDTSMPLETKVRHHHMIPLLSEAELNVCTLRHAGEKSSQKVNFGTAEGQTPDRRGLQQNRSGSSHRGA